MNEADVSRIMEAFGSMTGSVRRRASDEPEQTAASSTGRRRTDPLMETEEIHFGQEQEQHAQNPDPVTQRLEAQMLRDAIINFSDRNQIDTTDLLDQIYAEITGLAAQTRRPYQGPPWPPTQRGPWLTFRSRRHRRQSRRPTTRSMCQCRPSTFRTRP